MAANVTTTAPSLVNKRRRVVEEVTRVYGERFHMPDIQCHIAENDGTFVAEIGLDLRNPERKSRHFEIHGGSGSRLLFHYIGPEDRAVSLAIADGTYKDFFGATRPVDLLPGLTARELEDYEQITEKYTTGRFQRRLTIEETVRE